ncbi:MAG: site-specific DNA-methyltransferase [Gammaproteobacteria bacterium]|nr:site-specific DNA-methyltransferase [Gammaproteobacteria bacterium]
MQQASAKPVAAQNGDDVFLHRIGALDAALLDRYRDKIAVDPALTRRIVSFQANKNRRYYRWYKYKEAFSAELVERLLRVYRVGQGKILDPFAGAGTALFVSSNLGYDADGVELMPVGQKIIAANVAARGANRGGIVSAIDEWLKKSPWKTKGKAKQFGVLRITDGAYPQSTRERIGRYLHEMEKQPAEAKEILRFALLCVLESVSYTRKDGQCLRWDYRSGRGNGKNNFNKGALPSFDDAIGEKLSQISADLTRSGCTDSFLSLVPTARKAGRINLLRGSCLDILPGIAAGAYSGIVTSPPYCNRYDYTRTYALEHALLGVSEAEQVALRQAMLSCTVENKEKRLNDANPEWGGALAACDGIPLLREILRYLDDKREKRQLNNPGIARMVRGYFCEMACVIYECHRVLRGGGVMFMVNDNVRYAGASISVDAILSAIAESVGLQVDAILVLPQGKGNSSQQMGAHGREALRKCVYVWRKAA